MECRHSSLSQRTIWSSGRDRHVSHRMYLCVVSAVGSLCQPLMMRCSWRNRQSAASNVTAASVVVYRWACTTTNEKHTVWQAHKHAYHVVSFQHDCSISCGIQVGGTTAHGANAQDLHVAVTVISDSMLSHPSWVRHRHVSDRAVQVG